MSPSRYASPSAPNPAQQMTENSKGWMFHLNDKVRKVKGSSWEGIVCGFYSTSLTPRGYCVESSHHKGSVQIYPESAITLVK